MSHFKPISTCWIILVCDCCLQCPQLEAADAIHAQGDVGASQATQRDNMFRLGLHLKNVWSQYVRMFLHLIWLHASMWAGTSSRSTPAGRWTCRRCCPIAWAGLGPKTRNISRPYDRHGHSIQKAVHAGNCYHVNPCQSNFALEFLWSQHRQGKRGQMRSNERFSKRQWPVSLGRLRRDQQTATLTSKQWP